MMRVLSLLGILLLLPTCSSSGSEESSGSGLNGPSSYAAGMDNEVLVDVGDPPEQCSRATVEKGDSYFVPSKVDVEKFEKALISTLSARDQYGDGGNYFKSVQVLVSSDYLPDLKKDWARSFMGIVRGDRRFIYGGYAMMPREFANIDRGLWDSTTVCDGGPTNFGAEYDLENGTVAIIDFDGGL